MKNHTEVDWGVACATAAASAYATECRLRHLSNAAAYARTGPPISPSPIAVYAFMMPAMAPICR